MAGRLHPLSLLVALLPLCLLFPATANAESQRVERLLSSAENSFLDVEYEAALDSLASAEQLGEASDDQLERLLALRGTIYLLMEDEGQATAAYRRLLERAPGYQLPETHAPRAQAFLERLRAEQVAPPASVSIEHEPPVSLSVTDPLEVTARIRGVAAGHSVSLFYRPFGEGAFASTEMTSTGGDTFTGVIPLEGRIDAEEGGMVEYFIVVADGEERLANAGNPRNPLSFMVRGSGGGHQPVVRRWWFWTIVGLAVAAGLGLGLGFGLGYDQQAPTTDVPIIIQYGD